MIDEQKLLLQQHPDMVIADAWPKALESHAWRAVQQLRAEPVGLMMFPGGHRKIWDASDLVETGTYQRFGDSYLPYYRP